MSTSDSEAHPGTHFLRVRKRKPNEHQLKGRNRGTWPTLVHSTCTTKTSKVRAPWLFQGQKTGALWGKSLSVWDTPQRLLVPTPRTITLAVAVLWDMSGSGGRFPLTRPLQRGGQCQSGETQSFASTLPRWPASFLSFCVCLSPGQYLQLIFNSSHKFTRQSRG